MPSAAGAGTRRATQGRTDAASSLSVFRSRRGRRAVLKSAAMHDDPSALERRRQLANAACIVAGCCAVRGVMETSWVYAMRGVSWRLSLRLAVGGRHGVKNFRHQAWSSLRRLSDRSRVRGMHSQRPNQLF